MQRCNDAVATVLAQPLKDWGVTIASDDGTGRGGDR